MSVGSKEEKIVASVKFIVDPNNSMIISIESCSEKGSVGSAIHETLAAKLSMGCATEPFLEGSNDEDCIGGATSKELRCDEQHDNS